MTVTPAQDDPINRRIWCLIGGLLLVAVTAFFTLPLQGPPVSSILLLTVLVATSEGIAVRSAAGRQSWSINLLEVVCAIALMLVPGPWLIPSVWMGMLVVAKFRTGQPPVKVLFNASMHAATTSVALLIVLALEPSAGSVMLGLFVGWMLNISLVTRVISWVGGTSMLALLRAQASDSWLVFASNTGMGLLTALAYQHTPWAAVLALGPLLLLLSAYAAVWRQHDVTALLSEVVAAHDDHRQLAPFTVAQSLTRVARRSLGAERCTILIEGVSAADAYAWSVGGEVVPMEDTDTANFSWWAQAARSRDGDIGSGVRAKSAWLTLRAGTEGQPNALFHIERSTSLRGAFTAAERRMSQALVDQISSWLSSTPHSAREATPRELVEDVEQSMSHLMHAVASPQVPAQEILSQFQTLERRVTDVVARRDGA